MYEAVHERINVTIKFLEGKRPHIVDFTWRDKLYHVEKVHMLAKARKGHTAVWLFNVSTTNAAFKLRFDADTLEWFLEEYTWESGAE
jgi:hypothetical protein